VAHKHNYYHVGSAHAAESVGLTKLAAVDTSDLSLPALASLAGLGTAAISAPLIYRHMRKFRPSKYLGLRAVQNAARDAGDHFTRSITFMQRPEGALKRMWDRFAYGADDLVYRAPKGQQPKGPKKAPGAVRHFEPEGQKLVKGPSDLSGDDAMLQLRNRIGDDKWREYQFFEKHAPGAIPRTENIGNVLERLGYRQAPPDPAQRQEMLKALQAELRATYPEGFMMKERMGFQSGGAFPTEAHELADLHQQFGKTPFAEHVTKQTRADQGQLVEGLPTGPELEKLMTEWKKDPAYPGRVLAEIMDDPYRAIVQRKVQIEQPKGVSNLVNKVTKNPRSKEVRVHVEGGEAVPRLSAPRFDPTMTVMDRKKLQGATAYAQDIVNKLPPEYRQSANFAMDIAPLEGGGFTLIEANPGGQSGLLFPDLNPLSGPTLRRTMTGRWGHSVAAPVAAAGATAAGLGTAGAVYGAGRGIDALPQSKPKKPSKPKKGARGLKPPAPST